MKQYKENNLDNIDTLLYKYYREKRKILKVTVTLASV